MSAVPQDFSDIELVRLARTAMKRAHCPYSKFPVGAAILTQSGEIILGKFYMLIYPSAVFLS